VDCREYPRPNSAKPKPKRGNEVALHDTPWKRARAAYDLDGYKVEFAQGCRGHNQPG